MNIERKSYCVFTKMIPDKHHDFNDKYFVKSTNQCGDKTLFTIIKKGLTYYKANDLSNDLNYHYLNDTVISNSNGIYLFTTPSAVEQKFNNIIIPKDSKEYTKAMCYLIDRVNKLTQTLKYVAEPTYPFLHNLISEASGMFTDKVIIYYKKDKFIFKLGDEKFSFNYELIEGKNMFGYKFKNIGLLEVTI